MRTARNTLIVLLACSSSACALELIAWTPKNQPDIELLWLLSANTTEQQARRFVRRPRAVRLIDLGNIQPPQAQVLNVQPVHVLNRREDLLKVRMGPIIAPMPVMMDAGQLKPAISNLQKAFAESDARLLETVWDVEKARFIDVRNGKIVAQHSLTGKADGRVRRLSRLVRPERLSAWLKSSTPVTVNSDGKSALLNLRTEKRGSAFEATSLHLQRVEGHWKVVALVHSYRGR